MNEIATTATPDVQQFDYLSLNLPIQDVEFLKSKEVSMKARTHQVMIDNGRDLIEAKARVGHGAFGSWCKECLGLDRVRSSEMMRIADEFKCTDSVHLGNINKTTLLLCCKEETPESAKERILEEAKAGKVSTKRAQEIVDLENKFEAKIATLNAENTRLKEDQKTPAPASLNNLIPKIQKLLDDGDIMPAMAQNLSTMTDAGQMSWYSLQVQKMSLENQLKEKALKINELESRPVPEPKIIEKEVIPLDVQEKIKKAETALDKLRRAETNEKKARSDYNAISEKKHKLEYEISQLKEQLQVNDPKNIDAAFAEAFKDILEMLKSRLIRFEENRITTDYPMPKTWEVLNSTMTALSQFSDQAEGMVRMNSIEV